MIVWALILLAAVVSFIATFRMITRYGIHSIRFIGIAMLIAMLCVFAISSFDRVGMAMEIFGAHLASLWIAGVALIIALKDGPRENWIGIVLPLAIIIPIATVYLNITPYYWMDVISVMAAAGILLFAPNHIAEKEHREVGWQGMIVTTVLIAVTLILSWAGLAGVGISLFNTQYIVVQFSVLAFIALEILLILKARILLSKRDSMLLAMELATLDLLMGFVTAVIVWD